MTTIQVASTAPNTVYIISGCEHAPFMIVGQLVAMSITLKRLRLLKEAGYVIDDPDVRVTCHCGELKHWTEHECDFCWREYFDYQDDQQMYAELRQGM